MRPIKFRQAIFSRGKFHSWHYWGFLSEGLSVSPELNSSTHKDAQERSQQLTGLTDCDGQEIYEGDIYFQEVWMFGNNEGWHKGVIEYDTSSFIVRYRWGTSVLRLTGEVIGNIYENPELLKEI
jgi:hypothetical protein